MADSPWLDELLAPRTILDEGTALPFRSKLDFVGAGVTVTDDEATGKTIVTIGATSAYSFVEDNGTPVAQRNTLNFVGFTVADSGGKTQISMPASPTFTNVVISGTLTVQGDTVLSTVVDVADRVIHTNHSTGADDPVPTLMSGIAVHRGAVGGADRDHAAWVWDETDSRWEAAWNTSGDDATFGASLPIACSSIGIPGESAFVLGFDAASTGAPATLSVIGQAAPNGQDGGNSIVRSGTYSDQAHGDVILQCGDGGDSAPKLTLVGGRAFYNPSTRRAILENADYAIANQFSLAGETTTPGTYRDLVTIDGSNRTILGNGSEESVLNADTRLQIDVDAATYDWYADRAEFGAKDLLFTTGEVQVNRTSLGATISPGVILDNATAATSGATDQRSPSLSMNGSVWQGSAFSIDCDIYAGKIGFGGGFIFSIDYGGGGATEVLSVGHFGSNIPGFIINQDAFQGTGTQAIVAVFGSANRDGMDLSFISGSGVGTDRPSGDFRCAIGDPTGSGQRGLFEVCEYDSAAYTTKYLQLDASELKLFVASLTWDAAVASPVIQQTAGGDVAGDDIVLAGQGNDSAGNQAGAALVRGGLNAGAGADGEAAIQNASADDVYRVGGASGTPTHAWFGATLIAKQTVSGARDDPESALANLLSAIDTVGLMTDSTTAT